MSRWKRTKPEEPVATHAIPIGLAALPQKAVPVRSLPPRQWIHDALSRGGPPMTRQTLACRLAASREPGHTPCRNGPPSNGATHNCAEASYQDELARAGSRTASNRHGHSASSQLKNQEMDLGPHLMKRKPEWERDKTASNVGARG